MTPCSDGGTSPPFFVFSVLQGSSLQPFQPTHALVAAVAGPYLSRVFSCQPGASRVSFTRQMSDGGHVFSRLLTTEGRARSQGHVGDVTHTDVVASLPVGKVPNMTPLLRQGHRSREGGIRRQERPLS